MPSTTQLLTFTLTALLIIAVPGPSVLFVVSRSLTLGRRSGLVTVAGNAIGEYLQVTAVAFGIGAIVERSVALFTVIKLTGASYLIYLGIQALRHRHSLAAALGGPTEPKAAGAVLRDGFIVGVSNPKSIIFFAAILPQFVNRSSGTVPLQLLLLGGIFLGLALLSDSVWALAAGTARSWFIRSPRRLSASGGAGGLVMIGIGLRLAFTGPRD